ncbi:hypothetical protein [Actinocatenispora rupis]|uniref:hypothetical protein n=1 Tax=Actinocatenispora rupis TaxID=519421 RepID=UPI0019459E74|nr:hypothetical protein [Actinocatenispora rupis]
MVLGFASISARIRCGLGWLAGVLGARDAGTVFDARTQHPIGRCPLRPSASRRDR